MALTFDETPLQDTTWEQGSPVGTHTKRIRVSGFTTSSYYAMLDELYNDPSLPALGSPVDALFPLMWLRSWEVVEVQCGSPVPEIVLAMQYSTQAISASTFPDKDGPVVFRQRSLAIDWLYDRDRNDALQSVTYNTSVQPVSWNGQRSLMLYDCERYEEDNPEPRVRPLLSTVNSATWNGRAARTVLFSDFSADTRDEGSTYLCVYSFLYDPDGHDPTLFYLQDDGRIPLDVLPEGQIVFEAYPQTSFAPLNIVIPT